VLVRQNEKPNAWIDSHDWVTRTTAIPATSTGTVAATRAVPIRKPRSMDARPPT